VDVTLVRLPVGKQRPYAPGEPLVACTAPADERFPDNSVDMGTGYDCFDARSHPDASGIGATARENRQRLRRLMSQGGFTGISTEWWHFNLSGPGGAQDFPVARAAIS
jgi:D-alanyl-D-alanine dipeptidase